jgi:hypothetical protein
MFISGDNPFHNEKVKLVIGDGKRYNIAALPEEEQIIFRNAFIKLHEQYHFPDGVSGWFKQDQIHQKTHVHSGPSFLPWHRELCIRLEELLRKVEPGISLHYWDFRVEPEKVNILGQKGVFGASHGMVGPPFDVLHNKGIAEGSRGRRDPRDPTAPPQDPTLPPQEIVRDVDETLFYPSDGDERIINAKEIDINGNPIPQQSQWRIFRQALERAHNAAHQYIGGNIETDHFAFEDPFVFILHSNIDRLWASWQLQPGKAWRLNPDEIYGSESNHERITEFMDPWAAVRSEQKMRPWGFEWPAEKKNSKDDSIVRQVPKFDKYTTIS